MAETSLLSQILSGTKRTRRLPSFVIAALVTAAVAGPMAYQADQARGETAAASAAPAPATEPADPETIRFDTAETAAPSTLDGATLAGNVVINLVDPAATAVAFNLVETSGSSIAETVDGAGPSFDLLVDDRGIPKPLDTTQLADGRYELFVTITARGGDVRRTAVGFTVANGLS